MKDHLLDIGKIVAALAAVAAIIWPVWIKPEVEKMRAEDRAANAYAFAIIATAAASGDTATLATIARYGVPVGPPGR